MKGLARRNKLDCSNKQWMTYLNLYLIGELECSNKQWMGYLNLYLIEELECSIKQWMGYLNLYLIGELECSIKQWMTYLNLYLIGELECSGAGNPPHQDTKEEIYHKQRSWSGKFTSPYILWPWNRNVSILSKIYLYPSLWNISTPVNDN
jgi:hypothetical protein